MNYNFEWDPTKARDNLRKHRVSFERASQIFLDPLMLSIFDTAHSQTEDRWVTIGQDGNGIPIVVVHTFREVDAGNSIIRIISARKATKKEVGQYTSR